MNVAVAVGTRGVHFDADGYILSIAGGKQVRVGINENAVLSDVELGTSIELTDVHKACQVEGGSIRHVADDSATPIEFTVSCPEKIVAIDEGHLNLHTLSSTLANFAELLRAHGYVVKASNERFGDDVLRGADILVVSNALHPHNRWNWTEPVLDAFTEEEAADVKSWVDQGGSLLLIADHMPFPAAADRLAAPFGVQFNNGFAFDTLQIDLPKTCLAPSEVHVFSRAEGTLAGHSITNGRNPGERVESVATFTGQAFQIPESASSLMTFNATSVSLMPNTAWEFGPETPRIGVQGWSQGAVIRSNQGRAAFFGEAAMFTTQTCGPTNHAMGFQAKGHDTKALVLNVIHWLAGVTD